MNAHSKPPLTGDTDAAVAFLLGRPIPLSLSAVAIDRATGAKGAIVSKTFVEPDAEAIRKWIEPRQGLANIYYEINPKALDRLDRKKWDSRSKEETIGGLHTAGADVDNRVAETPEQCVERVLKILEEMLAPEAQPTDIMATGGGVQPIWDIEDPRPLDGSREAIEDAKLYSLGLARLLNGDSCFSIEHLMRVPGTINCPDAKKRGRNPPRDYALARRIGGTGKKVPLAALEKFKAKPPKEETAPADDAVVDLGDDLLVPARVMTILRDGRLPDDKDGGKDNTGSGWLFDACLGLARAGVPDAEIEKLIFDPQHKLSEVALKNNGREGRNAIKAARKIVAKEGVVLDRKDWSQSAAQFIASWAPTMRHHQNEFFRYRDGAYHDIEDDTVAAAGRAFLRNALVRTKVDEKFVLQPFKPSTNDVNELLSAAKHLRHVDRTDQPPPLWLPGWSGEQPAPGECISLRNGILHAPTRKLLPPTPMFFTLNALDFGYDPKAECILWQQTLDQYWPRKADGSPAKEVLLLQEMFGYLLLPWTSMQKIFMLLGVTRSGKTTIARVLRMLIGELNVCSPTLGSLGGEFGLMNTIGKLLAVISELAFGQRDDRVRVTGYLKQISGEDPIDVNRKNKGFWSGTLLLRFLLLANKMPSFADDSSALGARMVILRMTESFLGKEDPDLTTKLAKELPGILCWALAGYDRLRQNKKFTEPESSKESRAAFNRLASSTRAFVQDRCRVVEGPFETDEHIRAAFVREVDIYAAYKDWCGTAGVMPEKRSEFIEGVATAFPGKAKSHRVKAEIDNKRPWGILGIALSPGRERDDDDVLPF